MRVNYVDSGAEAGLQELLRYLPGEPSSACPIFSEEDFHTVEVRWELWFKRNTHVGVIEAIGAQFQHCCPSLGALGTHARASVWVAGPVVSTAELCLYLKTCLAKPQKFLVGHLRAWSVVGKRGWLPQCLVHQVFCQGLASA